jgi:outer membrane receptor for ferrienterochelin and colicin
MFGKKFLGGAAVSALAIAAATPAIAQETTAIFRGEVVNEAGAPITGANVTITHVPSGTVSTETTQEGGLFDVRGLRVGGPYRIEVTSADYQNAVVDDYYIALGDNSRVTIGLESANDTIVVTATRVGPDQLGAGSRLTRDEIQGSVSITRDIRDVARKDPLVQQNARGDGGLSIAGSNPRMNRISIDGTQAQDSFGLNTGGLPTRRGPISLDAVQAISISAAPFDVINGDFNGGAIDIVLRQGTNEFDGSLFGYYFNEGMQGTRIRDQSIRSFATQENYGGTLRGPIIQDKLFFALAYEYYTSADTTSIGPAGQGFATTIIGPTGSAMTLADIAAVTNVFSGATGYNSTRPFGAIPIAKGIADEKYSARLDWNITEDHRLSATYRFSESGLIQRTNLSTTSAGLDSQWYLTGEEDFSYVLQLNSDWSDTFSTEARASLRHYQRAQDPPLGQNFSDVRVCSTLTNLDAAGQTNPSLSCRNGSQTVGLVRFGPDQFRHANSLRVESRDASFIGIKELGVHTLKFGVQWSNTDVFNLFVPNSDGTYYFDSITDFQAGRAGELIYRNALTNNANDAAADFDYSVYSLLAQDSWDISDDLTVNLGIRYDQYRNEDDPAANAAFLGRYGFSNTETYDGRDIIMPRSSFSWQPTENLEISGGVGLFSGGLPDVFLSNSFSNTGVLDNTLTFQRTPTSQNSTSLSTANGFLTETSGQVNCSLNPTICNDALNVPVNNTFGTVIPATVRAALGGSTVSPTSETNSIAPDFEIPSDWRASVALKYTVFDGYNLNLSAVAVRNQRAIAFRDLRAQRLFVNGVQAVTPDGRIRYDGLSTAQRTSISGTTVNSSNPGANRDIQAFNPSSDDNGYGFTVAVGVDKEWDNGLAMGVSYTYQDLEEFSASARFSSTASSLYGGQFASLDPNTATRGESTEEIENSFQFNFGFRKEFVEDLETRFTLFGTRREGRSSSFTMNGGTGRNATFGVNRGAQLAYIPDLSGTVTVGASATTISSDSRVAFDSANTVTQLQNLVRLFELPQGQIVERGSYENRALNVFDFQFSQELPAFRSGHRSLLTFDIANLGNLINEDWGVVEEFPDDFRLFDVACAGADGVADNDGVLSCSRYRISGVNANQTQTRNADASRWRIQVGLKYEF